MYVCMYVYTYVCIVACSIMSGCSEEVRRQFFLPPPDSAISLNLSMHTNVQSNILHTNFGSTVQLCFSCDDGTRIEKKNIRTKNNIRKCPHLCVNVFCVFVHIHGVYSMYVCVFVCEYRDIYTHRKRWDWQVFLFSFSQRNCPADLLQEFCEQTPQNNDKFAN